jgi:peptide/nickel transport system permease protein
MNRTAALSLAVFALPFLFAGFLSPHDPNRQFRLFAAHPPSCGEPCFLLGTDDLGRDIFSRTLHGGRLSLAAGLCASLLATLSGGLFGVLAGFLRGWPDRLLSGAFTVCLSLPWVYLLLAVRAAIPLSLHSGLAFVVLMSLLGLAGSGLPFRVARQAVIAARDGDAVQIALGFGAGPAYLVRAHLIPAAVPALGALWTTIFPRFVVAEVSLSFLGLGAGEPSVSWGSLLAPLKLFHVLSSQWWMFAPALLLACCVSLCTSLDPASRHFPAGERA